MLDEIQKLLASASRIWVETNTLALKAEDYDIIREQVKQEIPILNQSTPLKSVNFETIVYQMPLE